MSTELSTTQDNDGELQRMMALAIQQGPEGVEALRALVELQREQEDRQAARDFAMALTRFGEDCPAIAKDASGAHNVRYATLDNIMHVIRPALTANGLSVSYDSEDTGERLTVWCIVRHVGGHSQRTKCAVPREAASKRMNVTQAEGSAMTYARRYALCLALDLTTGDRDTDAVVPPDDTPVSVEDADWIRSMAAEIFLDDKDKSADEKRAEFLAKMHVDTYAAIPARFFPQIKSRFLMRQKHMAENPPPETPE